MHKGKDWILVAWGTGQLGPMVLKSLVEKVRPSDIHLLVRNHERARYIMDLLGLPGDKFNYIMGNLGVDDVNTLHDRIPRNIGEIINLAGTVKFGEESAHEVQQTNQFGAITLATLAKERGAEFIHSSTAYVLWESDAILAEDYLPLGIKTKPKNPYEAAKMQTEKALALIHGTTPERFVLIRPSILTDSQRRADIRLSNQKEDKNTLPHACMWYFLPFMLLRKKLIEMEINDWVDLEWFELCWTAKTEINIVDNTEAGKIIASLATDGDYNNRVFHLVNNAPPTYKELTGWVLRELRFTWYKIEGESIKNDWIAWKKISELKKWPALLRILIGQYNQWTKANYLPYVTHTSRFAWGITTDNEKLAVDATRALMPEDWKRDTK